jgi:hypothetical protein
MIDIVGYGRETKRLAKRETSPFYELMHEEILLLGDVSKCEAPGGIPRAANAGIANDLKLTPLILEESPH